MKSIKGGCMLLNKYFRLKSAMIVSVAVLIVTFSKNVLAASDTKSTEKSVCYNFPFNDENNLFNFSKDYCWDKEGIIVSNFSDNKKLENNKGQRLTNKSLTSNGSPSFKDGVYTFDKSTMVFAQANRITIKSVKPDDSKTFQFRYLEMNAGSETPAKMIFCRQDGNKSGCILESKENCNQFKDWLGAALPKDENYQSLSLPNEDKRSYSYTKKSASIIKNRFNSIADAAYQCQTGHVHKNKSNENKDFKFDANKCEVYSQLYAEAMNQISVNEKSFDLSKDKLTQQNLEIFNGKDKTKEFNSRMANKNKSPVEKAQHEFDMNLSFDLIQRCTNNFGMWENARKEKNSALNTGYGQSQPVQYDNSRPGSASPSAR